MMSTLPWKTEYARWRTIVNFLRFFLFALNHSRKLFRQSSSAKEGHYPRDSQLAVIQDYL